MRTCQKCGNSIVRGQKICDVCGEYIFDNDYEQPQSYQRVAPHIPDKPTMVEPEQYVVKDDMSPTQYGMGLVMIVVASALILVGGTIAALVFFMH